MNDELKDDAVLFALGQLDDREHEAFIAALRREPELTSLVNEYREVFATLALSVEERDPPEGLRESILRAAAEVGKTRAGEGRLAELSEMPDTYPDAARTGRGGRSRRVSLVTGVPWTIAACLAVACGVLFFQLSELREENRELARIADPENIRIAALAAQTEALPGVSARVAWNPASGTGVLETQDLPEPPDENTYQLWVFEKDNPSPVSAGVFDPTADPRIVFRPERPVATAVAFAVSIEVAGGRPQPEGPVILVGAVQEG